MARVMVCDDAPDLRMVITLALSRCGHAVVEVDGGQEALDALSAAPPPDLLLLDLQMPEVDGWTVLDQLRASPAHADVRVLICSVKAEPPDLVSAWSRGCDGYLAKPFDLAQLVDAVDAVMQRPEAERATWRADRLRELVAT